MPKVTYKLLLGWGFLGLLCELILVYFFYRNLLAMIFLAWIPIVILYKKWVAWQTQMLFKIEVGFKEWIYYIKGALQSGKSVENAILGGKESLRVHLGETHPIQLGLNQVYRGLELHVPIEECINRFATETGLESMGDFAGVFEITKKQGGRMVEIMERTIAQIYEKIELREEIYALFAAKKMEQRIMCIMPFAIMLFIGSNAKGYFDSLYHNLQGVCIMSVCLLVYLAGIWWGEKMTEVTL